MTSIAEAAPRAADKGGIAAAIRRIYEATGIPQRIRIAAAEHALMAMSDRQLSDIGISRCQIAARVRGPADRP